MTSSPLSNQSESAAGAEVPGDDGTSSGAASPLGSDLKETVDATVRNLTDRWVSADTALLPGRALASNETSAFILALFFLWLSRLFLLFLSAISRMPDGICILLILLTHIPIVNSLFIQLVRIYSMTYLLVVTHGEGRGATHPGMCPSRAARMSNP